jgi:hypothetical protein
VPSALAQIDAAGVAALPDPAKRRLATLDAVVDDCMTENGATRSGALGSPDVAYTDLLGTATKACEAQIGKRADYEASDELRSARAMTAALQRAYGACVLANPDATPAVVAPVAASPAGVACRTLLNPLAGDDGVLAAIVTETTKARGFDDDGHFTLTWAGRTTRAQAAAAVGDVVQPGQVGTDAVIVVAFDGSFVPQSSPGGVTPARSKTLVFILAADGQVSDLAIRAEPFEAPDSVSRVGTGIIPNGPPSGSVTGTTTG